MTQFDAIDEIELHTVTGGWDWGRTGRAASDGAQFTFNSFTGAGRTFGGTPGAIAGGTLGVLGTPFLAPFGAATTAAADAVDQKNGRPEFRMDNAAIRAGF